MSDKGLTNREHTRRIQNYLKSYIQLAKQYGWIKKGCQLKIDISAENKPIRRP